jgi:hypothetical protein
MFSSRSAIHGLLAITLFLIISGYAVAAAAPQPGTMSEPTVLQVTPSAAHSTTSWDVRDPGREKFELPLLYLHHDRQAATVAERTMTIQLAGLGAATAIQLEAVSHHVNVSTGASHTETASFITPDRPCTAADPCTVEWTFDATMPSDLYALRVKDQAGETLWESRERPAFVALDTWDVALDDYTARVYYATLFPFARGQNDLDNRLSPAAVIDFIAGQFAPLIADTWHTQVEAWGFGPLHPDWDPDRVVEVIITDPPYALFDGTGTYTVFTDAQGHPYPERRIWWFAANNSFQAYDTLENGYKAVFAHEFFHLMQWNVLLSTGQAFTGQPTQRWRNLFIEAQAKFAPSVQYPEIELGKN